MNAGHGLRGARRRRRAAGPRRARLPAGRDDRVERGARPAARPEALRLLRDADVRRWCSSTSRCPASSGLELARVLRQFRQSAGRRVRHRPRRARGRRLRPAAVDYLLKPVHEDRLRRRSTGSRDEPLRARPRRGQVAVELGGVTRFVRRSEVRYVEAQGDYVRLHTATENHLVRMPLAALEAAVGRGRLRADPPQPAGRAATTSTRSGSVARPVHGRGRGHRAPGEPPARAGAPRAWYGVPAAARREPVTDAADPPRSDHQPPHVGRAVARTPFRRGGDRRADPVGEVYMQLLMRTQLRLAATSYCCWPPRSDSCRWRSGLLPRRPSARARRTAAVAAARRRGVPVCCSGSPAATSAVPSATRTSSSDLVEASGPAMETLAVGWRSRS